MKTTLLGQYLGEGLAKEISYEDLASLCLRIYCTLDGLPAEITTDPLDKEKISETFAWLASQRKIEEYPVIASAYGAAFHKTSDKGHWLEVISTTIFKEGREYDNTRAEQLLNDINVQQAAKPQP